MSLVQSPNEAYYNDSYEDNEQSWNWGLLGEERNTIWNSPPRSPTIYTICNSKQDMIFSNIFTGLSIDWKNTNRENSETIWGRILGAQRNLIIHLVIVALGAVAVETESLVGQKLLGASVNGGTDGNTAGKRLARRYYQMFQIWPKGFMEENSVLMHGWMERVGRSR